MTRGYVPELADPCGPDCVPIVRWLRAGPQALAGWLAGFGVMFLSLFPVSWAAPQGAARCPFAVGAMASWISAYCVCRWLLLVARTRFQGQRPALLLIGLCGLAVVAVQVVVTGVLWIGAGLIITPIGPIDFGNTLIGP